ncbi:hypothetical protein AYK20_01290 [Thermoplasmatales archaeon SG8-52-1]|nr:MAG: hypothetical protein AYK20_01290 [Thermoplasmatales archaeon SG8-52-1]
MNNKIIAIIICILFMGTVCSAYAKTKNNSITKNENIFSEFKIIESRYLDTIEVIDQKQTTDCGYGCPFFSNLWLAQGFIPTLETITRVELNLFKEGSITSDITLSIRSDLMGSDLTSVTIDGSQVYEYSNWIDFDFTDIDIITGEMYYIVCRTTGGSVINYYCCLFQVNNPYSGGEVWGSLNSGASWEIIEYPGYPDPDGCFITYGLDEAPNIPNINGPAKGKPGNEYTYKISTIDPEGHDVLYYIEWGDNTNSGWLGPYNSGEEISIKHTWINPGTYTIRAKAKDIYQATSSDWGFFTVIMPKDKLINLQLLNFFENHLNILKLIILILHGV